MDLSRVGWALRYCFGLIGASYSLLMSRMPALSGQCGAGEAEVGLAVLCLGAGSLLGFVLVPFAQRRVSTAVLHRWGSAALLVFLALCGFAADTVSLCVLFSLAGTSYAVAEVNVNTQGVLFEMRTRRHFLSSMYASYSCGCLFGALLGSVCASLELPPLATFAIGALLLGCGRFWAVRLLLSDEPPTGNEREKGQGSGWSVPGFTILCGVLAMAAYTVAGASGVLAMAAYTVAGASGEWSALLLHSVKGADEDVAALAFGCFSVALATGRLFGDRLRRELGDCGLLLCGTALSLVGQSCFLLLSNPCLCLVGYVLAGLGFAPVLPVLFSRGARRGDITPRKAAVVISTLGNIGLLVVPPAIGCLAEHFGLDRALFLPFCLTLAVAFCSPFFRERH